MSQPHAVGERAQLRHALRREFRDAQCVLAGQRLAADEHLLLECLQIDHAETIAGAGQPSGSCGTVPSRGAMR